MWQQVELALRESAHRALVTLANFILESWFAWRWMAKVQYARLARGGSRMRLPRAGELVALAPLAPRERVRLGALGSGEARTRNPCPCSKKRVP